jgi:predicted transglutaminase-like cysteine proteinase
MPMKLLLTLILLVSTGQIARANSYFFPDFKTGISYSVLAYKWRVAYQRGLQEIADDIDVECSLTTICFKDRVKEAKRYYDKLVSKGRTEKAYRRFFENVNYLSANAFVYKRDIKNHGKSDYWATPFEALSKGYGDCEDYAIMAMFIFMEVGIAEENMEIIHIKRKGSTSNSTHAALVIRDEFENYYLIDNDRNIMHTMNLRSNDFKRTYDFLGWFLIDGTYIEAEKKSPAQ